jgi:hypothetical protein
MKTFSGCKVTEYVQTTEAKKAVLRGAMELNRGCD